MARNTPFRGSKGCGFEGGIRVPCIIRWPERIIPGSVSAQPCITMDLTASIAALAHANASQNFPFDGIDIISRIVGNQPDIPRTLFWRYRRGDHVERAVRDGDMKYLCRDFGGGKVEEYLFDLAGDPKEQSNLFLQKPEVVDEQRTRLKEWEDRVQNDRGRL